MKSKRTKLTHDNTAHSTDSKGRKWDLSWCRRGYASDFICHLQDLRKKGILLVVLYVRASSHQQAAGGNLQEAIQDASNQIVALGFNLLRVFSEVAHSSISSDRPQFDLAVDYAEGRGAILVAPTRDRFLRHGAFARRNRSEPPTVAEYRMLRHLTRGVPLATIAHPDRPARGLQTIRGQKAKQAKPGRPRNEYCGAGWTKRRKAALLPAVVEWLASGKSYSAIAKHYQAMATRRGKRWYPAPTVATLWSWLHPK